MATLDVLASSNWGNVICSRVEEWYSQEYRGWSGTYWKSEGKTTFDNCLEDTGKIVTGIQIDLTSTINPNIVATPPNTPWVRVKTSNLDTVALEQLSSSGSQLVALSYYDHETAHIDEVMVESVLSWTIYEYSGNELNENEPNYFLDITGLSLVYQLPASPARWQDYRRTYEISTGA